MVSFGQEEVDDSQKHQLDWCIAYASQQKAGFARKDKRVATRQRKKRIDALMRAEEHQAVIDADKTNIDARDAAIKRINRTKKTIKCA